MLLGLVEVSLLHKNSLIFWSPINLNTQHMLQNLKLNNSRDIDYANYQIAKFIAV